MVSDAMEVDVRPLAAFGGCVAVNTAMINMYEPIRNAPPSRDPLLPIRSTRNRRKNKQDTTLTTPKKPVIKRLSWPAPTAAKT